MAPQRTSMGIGEAASVRGIIARMHPSPRMLAHLTGGAVAALVLLLAGCATVGYTPAPWHPGMPPPSGPRYEQTPGQDANTIAELRAAPPHAPEIADGSTPASDESNLTTHGYVRVGTGYLPPDQRDPRGWALQQGQRVGADRILVYPANAAPEPLRIDFYVRYRLPFGATFRSLTKQERAALAAGGVQIGEIVYGTPASEANLQHGDFVLKFNGQPIADRAAFEQMLRDHLGQRVTLTIRRGGFTLDRLVRLGVVAKDIGARRQ